MSLLSRVIKLSRWSNANNIAIEDIPGDAITNCLKTTGNKLSVWKIESESLISEVALAFITAPQKKSVEALHIVLLDPQYIDSNTIRLNKSEGNSILRDTTCEHFDLIDINYRNLGKIAFHVQQQISNEKVVSCSRKEIIAIIARACKDRRIDLEALGYSETDKTDIRKLL